MKNNEFQNDQVDEPVVETLNVNRIRSWVNHGPWWLILMLSFVLAFALFGINLRAEFGLLDDHQIVHYFGSDGRVFLSEFWAKLIETEVGKPGEYLRYRPFYYALRIVEAIVWGPNVALWYGFRIVLFTSVVFLSWFFLQKYIGFILAGLFTLAVVAAYPDMWVDIFSRLGPSEAYAAVGFVLFMIGVFMVSEGLLGPPQNDLSGWVWLFIGAFITIGSKENFLPLILIVSLLVGWALWRQQGGRWLVVAWLILLGYTVFIAGAIFAAINRFGTTFYGDSAAIVSRTTVFLQGMQLPVMVGMAAVLITSMVAWLLALRAKRGRLAQILAIFVVVALLSYLLYLSQYVFYNGDWPRDGRGRYNFPGVLAMPFFLLVCAWAVITIAKTQFADKRVAQIITVVVGMLMLFAINGDGFDVIRADNLQKVTSTQSFAAKLARVVVVMHAHPDAYLVLESHRVIEYETIYSWTEFLHGQGVENLIFLRMHGYSAETAQNTLEQNLTRNLLKTVEAGWRGISPDSARMPGNACYSLQISGQTETECLSIE